ncbi:hypothetical protein C482_10087 [Natrialba chahannaoensis JCM 10990]|uniref:Uncharacterized protein n=1 Tax=Natrialba chahannaoensis JCM 10990 TaxID=1227492 RepID=M0APF5_9EURY|nr:hypothetical protein C482_10087 [Natrialba chahannaoensis JCM 10990]
MLFGTWDIESAVLRHDRDGNGRFERAVIVLLASQSPAPLVVGCRCFSEMTARVSISSRGLVSAGQRDALWIRNDPTYEWTTNRTKKDA